MAGKDYGGLIRFRLSSGATFSLRGTINLKTAGRSIEAIVNQDRSTDRVETLTPYAFEISFADRGDDLEALMKADRFDATFIEDDTGVSHYYTRSFFVGEPSSNRMNGEVTGVSGAAEAYVRKG
ncbi:phage tail tube protein [Hoeflea sp. BAL378]|uniref:phage tail tube protein n=1 Tax=Hoeflea sp. BAL378 TaxID=1547437 RepID=UPI00068B1259|nr:phage tail tube protein [Hoeflea sp. BAL378]